ncbi:MAG: hypothetical protein JSU91_01150 [Thermoplasmatales archaeon]|nr:MAG: hypothetical protein JSU91_01150 [Thermoplasmatales archaeon]
MSTKKKVLICFSAILLIIIIFGYILLFTQETTFSLVSSNVVDDNGFPSLLINFNANNIINVNLISQDNQIFYTDKLYTSQKEILIPISSYRETLSSSNYHLEIFDNSMNKIYNKKYTFQKSNLLITSIEGQWWKENQDYSLIGVIITVKNNGDVPIYPYSIDLTINGKSTSAQVLPTVVLPNDNQLISCYLYIDSISVGEKNCDISIYDKNNEILAESSDSIIPEENVPIQHFSWEYNNKIRKLDIPLPQYLHDYYSDLDRLDINDYGAYIFDPYDDQYLSLVKDLLLSIVGNADDVTKINLIASFVQYLEYQWDDPNDHNYEYPRYPVEILDKQPCDCEDKSILAGNIFMLMGYNISLLDVPYHMAIGVNINQELSKYDYFINEYYYLETTYEDHELGDSSGAWPDIDEVTIYPLTSRPLLHHEWKKAEGVILNGKTDIIKLRLIVENLGTKEANEIRIDGAFYTSAGQKYNLEKSSISTLKPGEKKQINLQLNVPHGKSTILKTQIYMNGILIEEKESETQFS